MFPLALIFLLGSAATIPRLIPKRLLLLSISLVIFFILCSPWVYFLSRSKGHLSMGESAKLNYAWFVNGVEPYVHWQGGPDSCGVPTHPPRIINTDPTVYEFATPIAGTYPLW